MANRESGRRYELKAEFDAPLDFVYRWCTDYTPQDAKVEGEDYTRRIVRRSPREVVYEDLSDSKEGWFWARHVVRLMPPNHWHSESVGSHRLISLDYRLTKQPGGRTRLTMKAHRRQYGIGAKNPTKAFWQRNAGRGWKNFGRSLERDYRKSRKGAKRRKS
jgi:hypothetical protein